METSPYFINNIGAYNQGTAPRDQSVAIYTAQRESLQFRVALLLACQLHAGSELEHSNYYL